MLVLIVCATLVLGRVVSFFDPSGLAVPVLAGALLLAILVNVPLAMMVGFMTAGLVSIQYGGDWSVLVVGCAMCAAGLFGIYVVRRRSDITSAALKATAVGLLIALAMTMATETLFSETTLRRIALIALNGGVCVFIVPGLLSPLERLFGITTDIQLLEYSDLNNQMLSRQAIETPATYAHGLMMGQLAEAAADAVESGVRSMKSPSEERVREFVDKIVASRAADRQFDECPLTLKDLDVIAEVVSKRMLSALHTRIAYPETAAEGDTDNVIPMQGARE